MKNSLYKIDYIKEKIDKYEYVSFDIFDTLIKRNVNHNEDIFTLTYIEYKNRTGKQINNYKQKRIQAEIKAKDKRDDKEPDISEIFDAMEIQEDKKMLMQIEIELEQKICQQNKEFYEIYEYCKEKNKKIIIISDMYLNKKYIEKILNKNGITQYEKIFVSNEEKLNKHTGKIYPNVLKTLGIKSDKIIHIGDSKRADYLMPKKYGISTILIPKKINKLNYYNDNTDVNSENKFYYNIIESFINNNMPESKDIYFKIGYEVLGILLYGYSKWLLKKLKEKEIEKVFFLAREGALLKKAFDKLNNQDIESKYLYASRRSTRVALLSNIEKIEDIFDNIKMRRIVDLKSFFINVGLDINSYKNILDKYNCKEETNIKEIQNFEKLFNEIKKDIIQNAKQEEENIVTYLKQQNFSGNIAICDVGWVGTMQHSLETISKNNNISIDATGFYMGQSDKAKEFIEKGMKTEAYLFDYKSDEYLQIRAFLNLFESFFLAQHGTTIRYEVKNGKSEPVLDECEYTKQELAIFKNIQDGAMQFIDDYSKFEKCELQIEPNIAWINFKKLGLEPTNKDIKLFGKISYLETQKVQFANPQSILYYMVHPKKMYYDFCNCSWKIGFLKKLFKIKLNYFKIYKLMLKNKR